MTAFPEQGFEIQNKKQLDFICPGLDYMNCSWIINYQKEFEMQLY